MSICHVSTVNHLDHCDVSHPDPDSRFKITLLSYRRFFYFIFKSKKSVITWQWQFSVININLQTFLAWFNYCFATCLCKFTHEFLSLKIFRTEWAEGTLICACWMLIKSSVNMPWMLLHVCEAQWRARCVDRYAVCIMLVAHPGWPAGGSSGDQGETSVWSLQKRLLPQLMWEAVTVWKWWQ